MPLIEQFLLAWIPLFVALDPLGMIPLFLGLTSDLSPQERRQVARQATLTAAAVAVGFMLLGKAVFTALGIGVADFQIAGGLVLLVLAGRDLVAPERVEPARGPDPGVVPLGLPLIAGPGLLTALLILMDGPGFLPTLLALAVNLALVHLALRYGARLARLVSLRGLRALSKVIALLLAAFAVSMIRRGWQSL